ncbi:monocarboxylate transporter 12-like [Ylistrum balloti]|uniref:monocarboxylate transporter 12-like n=1 Tax=Ylistrum balloti TaxID=509963 RepID=UPI00290582DC|nr:monocarboxylate transporter 12-like [Ylistrum balloti]
MTLEFTNGYDNNAYVFTVLDYTDNEQTEKNNDRKIHVHNTDGTVETQSKCQPGTFNSMEITTNSREEGNKACLNSVDHGWAWVVLLGVFFTSMFLVGSSKSFGILHVELSTKFQVSNKALSISQSLAGFLQQFLGAVSAALTKRYSHRTLIFWGGLMIGAGLVLSSFATSIGVGYGITFSPAVVIVSQYFSKYRSIASGISLAGGGLGGMVFPYFIRFLLTEYGLQGALLVYGGVMFNICVCALLIRPLNPKKLAQQEQAIGKNTKPDGIKREMFSTIPMLIWRSMKDLEWKLFKELDFILLIFAVFFAMFGYNSLFNIVPQFMKEIGFPNEDGAFILLIFGLTDLIGRILFGFVLEIFPSHRKGLFTMMILLFGFGITVTSFLRRKLYLCVFMGCYGLFAGGFNGTLMIITLEFADLERLPSAWGFVCWSSAIAFLLNPISTSAIRDITETWSFAFQLSGAVAMIAVPILLFKCLKSRCLKI